VSALGGGAGVERALDALFTAGVVREGPPAATLPCGEGVAGCAREVRHAGAAKDGAPRFIAVCGARPRECDTIDVEADALREVTVSIADLVKTLQGLMGITDGRRSRGSGGGEWVLVGEQARDDGAARDVVLMVRPGPHGFDEWLEARSRGARPTLVLLPTARALSADAVQRHGPGSHVEVDALADALALKSGALALGPRLRAVRAPDDDEIVTAPTPVRGSARSLPKPARWQDVKILLVDGETVTIEVAGKFGRLTFIDMGLAGRGNRKPTKAWSLLTMCCEGQGRFRWKPFGTFENARQVVARLRKSLRATFGLDDDPFHEFSYTDQWRTKFRAGVVE
jgi:hypothetical protein